MSRPDKGCKTTAWKFREFGIMRNLLTWHRVLVIQTERELRLFFVFWISTKNGSSQQMIWILWFGHWWASLRATRFGVRRVGLLERCPYICRFVLRGRKQMGYLPKLSTVHSSRQTSNILPFQMVLRCFEMFECFILRLTSKTEVLQTPSALEFGNLEFFGKIWNFWRIWNSWGFFRIF